MQNATTKGTSIVRGCCSRLVAGFVFACVALPWRSFADAQVGVVAAQHGVVLTVKNDQTAPLNIYKVIVGCGLNPPATPAMTVAPQLEGKFDLAYSLRRPLAVTTTEVKLFTIAGAAPQILKIRLPDPGLRANREQIVFAPVYVNEARPRSNIDFSLNGQTIESLTTSTNAISVEALSPGSYAVSLSTDSVGKIRGDLELKIQGQDGTFTIPVAGEVLPAVAVSPEAALLGELNATSEAALMVKLAPGYKISGLIFKEGSSLTARFRQVAEGYEVVIRPIRWDRDIDEVLTIDITGKGHEAVPVRVAGLGR